MSINATTGTIYREATCTTDETAADMALTITACVVSALVKSFFLSSTELFSGFEARPKT
jgi:hypothetical protein